MLTMQLFILSDLVMPSETPLEHRVVANTHGVLLLWDEDPADYKETSGLPTSHPV